jgi:hypothetical protein
MARSAARGGRAQIIQYDLPASTSKVQPKENTDRQDRARSLRPKAPGARPPGGGGLPGGLGNDGARQLRDPDVRDKDEDDSW